MAPKPSDNQPDQRMAPTDNDNDNERKPDRDAVPNPVTAGLAKKPVIKPS